VIDVGVRRGPVFVRMSEPPNGKPATNGFFGVWWQRDADALSGVEATPLSYVQERRLIHGLLLHIQKRCRLNA